MKKWIYGRLATATAVCVSVLVVTAAPSLAATVYEVDVHSSACSDVGPGSASTPFCTIAPAAKRAVGGDIVLVHPGRYREQVTPAVSGSAAARITFRATGNDTIIQGSLSLSNPAGWTTYSSSTWVHTYSPTPRQVFLDGDRLTQGTGRDSLTANQWYFDTSAKLLYVDIGGPNPAYGHEVEAGAYTYGFKLLDRSGISVEGFEFKYQNTSAVSISSASDVSVLGASVSYSASYGIRVDGSTGPVRIADSDVRRSGSHGIQLRNSSNIEVSSTNSYRNILSGIQLYGTSSSVIAGNTLFSNAKPATRVSNGIDVNGSSSDNVIEDNRAFDNQDSGIQIYNGSNRNLVRRNASWNNGDHGLDTLRSTGTRYVSNSVYGNKIDGISIEGTSTGTTLADNISAANGGYDLYVESGSESGFSGDFDLFWRASGNVIKFAGTKYTSVAAFSATTGHEANGIGRDPLFADPATGNLRLREASPAIDSADAGASGFRATDIDGVSPFDDAAVADTGRGTPTFADRGAFERTA